MSRTAPSGRSTRPVVLACHLTLDLPLATLSAAQEQPGMATCYELDQRNGTIGFTLDHLGMVNASGEVLRFTAHAAVPLGGARGAAVALELDTSSVRLAGPRGAHERGAPDRLRSTVRFRSTSCEATGADRWTLRGLLEVGGVTRLVVLAVHLNERHVDPITRTQIAEFLATTLVQPSSFDLNGVLMTDAVELRIRARVERDVPV